MSRSTELVLAFVLHIPHKNEYTMQSESGRWFVTCRTRVQARYPNTVEFWLDSSKTAETKPAKYNFSKWSKSSPWSHAAQQNLDLVGDTRANTGCL
ncbi:hypothetical protein ElyMa_006184400 [Elysia marginata]|uniref:Uncharacterized protein n=1 Tax=Elysia marginata TaxID=1093978 RepID=A0AAV4H384_9GAST|nr:hypothetical protein ElyMa_006184400 [Elysia marginata]